MFGKKTPTQPWYIQVLTPDLSVEGFIDPDHTNLMSVNLEKPSSWILSGLTLAQPRLSATGDLKLSATTAATFATALHQVAIYIPRDQPSQTYITDQFGKPNHVIQAICFVGPYTVAGQLNFQTEQITGNSFTVIRDAQVTRPGNAAQWPGVSVPLALLHPTWLQGYLTA